MALITLWYGGKFLTDPDRRYVGGSSTTITLGREEFTVAILKAKVRDLGYKSYKLNYVDSLEDLQNNLYRIDKIRDFNNLREKALSNGNISIFIEGKRKSSIPEQHSNTNPSSSNQKEQVGTSATAGGRPKKRVTRSPRKPTSNDNGAEDLGAQVPEEAPTVPRDVKNKCPSINCDVARYTKLINDLSRNQRQWVKDMGFRHLLKIKINHIEPSFGVWVTSMFDAQNRTLTVRDHISVPIDDEMVGWVLGIPAGDDLFHPEEASTNQFRLWKMKYKQDTMYGAILESVLCEMVLNENSNKTKFQRHFLLCTLGVLLCPMQKREWISPLHVQLLGNASKAYKYNWGKYVLDWLVRYREKYDTAKEGLGGCTLLLLVIYLDRIVHGRNVEWSTKSCRIRYWHQSDVNAAINNDKDDNGCYGFAPGLENVEYGQEYPSHQG